MAKNQFQDIVPPQRRSIRDVPLPEGREREPRTEIKTPPTRPRKEIDIKRNTRAEEPIRQTEVPLGYPELNDDDRTEPRFRAGLWFLVLIALIVVFFGISYLFAGAIVKVTPKSEPLSVNQTFNANQDALNGALPYSVITLEKDGSAEEPANGDQNVSTKASGVIVVYNNYSSSPQSLIATTRFQTPEGLVYRIDKDITVPGQSTVNGQKSPGSVEAIVYADQAGAQYNVGLKDFSIPGFQGTSKATAFYARSKTPLSGGFVGTVKKVSDADLADAHSKIETDLKQQFVEQANSQKPDNFILYPGALVTTFTTLPNASSTNANTVLVKEVGTAHAIVFDRDVLNQYLLSALGITTASSTLSGIDNLTFSLQNPEAIGSNSTTTNLSINLNGNVNLISNVETDKLREDLVGISRSKFVSVLTNYPAIEKAEVIFKPFWRWAFPDKADKIKVEIVNPS